MRAGKLRHLVTLQKLEQIQNPTTGELVKGWSDVANVWADIQNLSAREFISAQAVQSEIIARIVIRYRSDVEPKMRIKYRNKVYNIHGALPDLKSGLEYLTLPVSEGVNDG